MEKKTTAAKPVVKTTAKEASKDTVKEADQWNKKAGASGGPPRQK